MPSLYDFEFTPCQVPRPFTTEISQKRNQEFKARP
jgi:hypothetical protein